MDRISCILPNKLYLSSIEAILKHNYKLDQLGITMIINVTNDVSDVMGEWKNVKIPIMDDPRENIYKYFDSMYVLIENELNNGGRVLVHCYAGISRSATIVISYLMRKFKCCKKVVYTYIISHRDVIHPNDGFQRQLDKYEQQLNNNNG